MAKSKSMNPLRTLKLIRGAFHAMAWLLGIEGAWSYLRTRIREMKKFSTVTEEKK